MKLPIFTLGVEKYQIIDLKQEICDRIPKLWMVQNNLNEQVKAEMHQSVVEVALIFCNNVNDAEMRFGFTNKIVELADKQDLNSRRSRERIRFQNGRTSPLRMSAIP
jgi:carboxylate-amine ligase